MDTIIGRMAALLGADTSEFDAAFNRSGDKVQAFERKVEGSTGTLKRNASALDTVERAAGKLAVTVGTITLAGVVAGAAATAGALALATKEAIDFESSFTGVRKTVDASEQEFNDLSQAIRNMSKEIPVNVNELNKIGEAAGQLGIKKESITEFIDTIAKISVTTNLTADQAADGFARFANIMQTPQERIGNLGSAVVALGNNFAGTESDILAMAMRLAGAGHTVGMTEGDVLGLATALSSVGIEAEAGGSAFSKVFIDMADAVAGNSKKARQMLQDMAQVMGISAEELGKKFKEDAAGSVVELVTSLGKLQKQGADVFGILESLGIEDIRMRDAILRAAGASDLFAEAVKLGNDALEENTALNAEAAKRFETTESKINLAQNSIRDLAITVGGPFADAFGELAGTVTDTLKSNEDATKQLVDEFTPAIQGVTDELKPLIKGFLTDAPKAMETFGAAIITLKGYFDILSRTIDTFASKIGVLQKAGQAAGDIGGLLFGDFQRDTEAMARKLRGEKPRETPQQEADRLTGIHNRTGFDMDQIMAAQNSANAPTNRHLTAEDFEQSGGVWVLKADAEARLKAAEEATEIYQQALAEEQIAKGLSDTPQPEPGGSSSSEFTGSAPETKEARIAREKAEKEEQKKAEQEAAKALREAKAAAQKAAREAEQAAERHAEMIASFNATIADGAFQVENNLGKFADRANRALGNVFSEDASGTAGANLAKTIGDLIKQAKDAGVDDAEELGQALIAAASKAVVERTPEAKAAVQGLIEQMNAAILEHSQLTLENFGKAFDKEALSVQLGNTGAAIMDALEKSINGGGTKAIDALAKATASMRRTIIEDVSPELAAEHAATMMELLAEAIETKSPEAIQALENFLRDLNQLLPLEKAGEAMAEKINKAIDSAAEKIEKINTDAEKKITDAMNSLSESRNLRQARQDVADAQEKELKEATDAINTEREAYRDMRDEQHILDERRASDIEELHSRTMEDNKLLKDFEDAQKLSRQHDTSSTGGGERMERARREGLNVGQRADPALEARKAFEKKKKELEDARKLEDAEIERKRGIEDDLRKTRLAEREEDQAVEEGYVYRLNEFKKTQTKNRQTFEDDQADEALEREKQRIRDVAALQVTEANKALAQLEADENEKFAKLQAKLEALASVNLPLIETAGDEALDGMVKDAEYTRDLFLEMEASQKRLYGGTTGAPGAKASIGTSGPVATGGIDDPPSADPQPDPEPEPDPGPGPDPYYDAFTAADGPGPSVKEGDPFPMASGDPLDRRPSMAGMVASAAPPAAIPVQPLAAMLDSAAAAGIAMQGDIPASAGPKTSVTIDMPNAQFIGVGSAKQFVRQINDGLSASATDKQAVQGD